MLQSQNARDSLLSCSPQACNAKGSGPYLHISNDKRGDMLPRHIPSYRHFHSSPQSGFLSSLSTLLSGTEQSGRDGKAQQTAVSKGGVDGDDKGAQRAKATGVGCWEDMTAAAAARARTHTHTCMGAAA